MGEEVGYMMMGERGDEMVRGEVGSVLIKRIKIRG